MANIASAKKRARQAEKRGLHNSSMRSTMRTCMKKVLSAVNEGQLESAKDAFKAAVPIIDRMAGKGIIHKNTAARYKSRLNLRVKKLALGA